MVRFGEFEFCCCLYYICGQRFTADMPRRCDLLVSELLDTELLGEGVLATCRDARTRLLTPEARCIPMAATVYAQVVAHSACPV